MSRGGSPPVQSIGRGVGIMIPVVAMLAVLDTLTTLGGGTPYNESAYNATAFEAAGESMVETIGTLQDLGTLVLGVLGIVVGLLLGLAALTALLSAIRARQTHAPATIGPHRRITRTREEIASCFYCDANDCEGVRSVYVVETVLFGVALYTHERIENTDCVDCFLAKMPQTAALDMAAFDDDDITPTPKAES